MVWLQVWNVVVILLLVFVMKFFMKCVGLVLSLSILCMISIWLLYFGVVLILVIGMFMVVVIFVFRVWGMYFSSSMVVLVCFRVMVVFSNLWVFCLFLFWIWQLLKVLIVCGVRLRCMQVGILLCLRMVIVLVSQVLFFSLIMLVLVCISVLLVLRMWFSVVVFRKGILVNIRLFWLLWVMYLVWQIMFFRVIGMVLLWFWIMLFRELLIRMVFMFVLLIRCVKVVLQVVSMENFLLFCLCLLRVWMVMGMGVFFREIVFRLVVGG